MQKGPVVKTTELEHDTLLLKTQERRLHFKENVTRGWYRVLGKKYAENGFYLFHLKLGILYSEPAQLLAK